MIFSLSYFYCYLLLSLTIHPNKHPLLPLPPRGERPWNIRLVLSSARNEKIEESPKRRNTMQWCTTFTAVKSLVNLSRLSVFSMNNEMKTVFIQHNSCIQIFSSLVLYKYFCYSYKYKRITYTLYLNIISNLSGK